ncbi:MAG: hypothetical protein ACXW5U_20020 [Thermoanaerobaculia bacterium]
MSGRPWSHSQRVGRRVWPADIQERALDLSTRHSTRHVVELLRAEFGFAPSHQTIANWRKVAAFAPYLKRAARIHSDASVLGFLRSPWLTERQAREAVLRTFRSGVLLVRDIAAQLHLPPAFINSVLNADRLEEATR